MSTAYRWVEAPWPMTELPREQLEDRIQQLLGSTNMCVMATTGKNGPIASPIEYYADGLDLCRTREVPFLLHDFAWALGAAYHGTGRRAEGVALMEDSARAFAHTSRERRQLHEVAPVQRQGHDA